MRHIVKVPEIHRLINDPLITDIITWCDNGNHFHSNKFLYFTLVELPYHLDLGVKHVDTNFFPPYHGKNPVDQHFAKISHFVAKFSMEWPKGIRSTKHVVLAIEKGEQLAAKHYDKKRAARNGNAKRDLITIPLDCDLESVPKYISDPLQKGVHRIEATLVLPAVSAMTHFAVEHDTGNNKKNMKKWFEDKTYWETFDGERVLNRFDDDPQTRTQFAKMVQTFARTPYSITVKTKPYPYSDDSEYKEIDGNIVLEPVPQAKMAPDKVPKEYKVSALKAKFATRDKVFGCSVNEDLDGFAIVHDDEKQDVNVNNNINKRGRGGSVRGRGRGRGERGKSRSVRGRGRGSRGRKRKNIGAQSTSNNTNSNNRSSNKRSRSNRSRRRTRVDINVNMDSNVDNDDLPIALRTRSRTKGRQYPE